MGDNSEVKELCSQIYKSIYDELKPIADKLSRNQWIVLQEEDHRFCELFRTEKYEEATQCLICVWGITLTFVRDLKGGFYY